MLLIMVCHDGQQDPADHTYYQALPGLHAATIALSKINDFDALMLTIGNLFLKHGMTELFGVCLLHRHFDMQSNEVCCFVVCIPSNDC